MVTKRAIKLTFKEVCNLLSRAAVIMDPDFPREGPGAS
jgi:hypothetical protein